MITFIQSHSGAILIVVVYVLTAAINSLPDPSTEKFEFYPWLYHTARQLINAVPAQYKPKALPNS